MAVLFGTTSCLAEKSVEISSLEGSKDSGEESGVDGHWEVISRSWLDILVSLSGTRGTSLSWSKLWGKGASNDSADGVLPIDEDSKED